MRQVDSGQPRLQRCGCDAIVEIWRRPNGREIRLEATRWPWKDLPPGRRYLPDVDGIARKQARGQQMGTLDHDTLCPVRVRSTPEGQIPTLVWQMHRSLLAPPPDPRAEQWARLRLDGWSLTLIAERDGVSPSLVSTQTRHRGPFPRPGSPSKETIGRWVALRATGISAAAIARDANVSAETVRRVTRPYGPYRRQQTPPGLVTIAGIAHILNIPWGSAGRLVAAGKVPSRADTYEGSPVWDEQTIRRWAATIPKCPHCDTRLPDLSKHISITHNASATRKANQPCPLSAKAT